MNNNNTDSIGSADKTILVNYLTLLLLEYNNMFIM